MLIQETLIYWLTVMAYTATALLCLLSAWQAYRKNPWGPAAGLPMVAVLGIMILVLGTNKILNFFAGLVDWVRITTREQGTYAGRQFFQFIFILILGGCYGLGAIYTFSRKIPISLKILIICTLSLLLLVITRAVSLHQVDIILNWRLFGVRLNWLIELGILLVSFLSVFALRNSIRNQNKRI